MLNSWMLLGLIGLSIPIIIHLIHKQKMQPQLLATLRFLDKEDVSNVFQLMPRDLLQLLLRLLLLALFILLMVRFTAPSGEVGPRTLSIILDNSMSMKYKLPNGKTLFDAHKEQIADLIRSMSDQDLFSFTLVGDRVFVETGFTRDRQLLEAALKKAGSTDGGGRSLYRVLKQQIKELRSRKALNSALLVFSDLQQSHFLPEVGEVPLREHMKNGQRRVFLVTEPIERKPNVAVDWAVFHPARAFLGANSRVTAAIRNCADKDQNVEVSFKEGLRPGESRMIMIHSSEVVRVDLAHSFDSPVDSACEASISDDGFACDNRFFIPMQMRERRQILLVAPVKYSAKGPSTGYTGVDLLAFAVNPEEALGLSTGTHTAIKRITPEVLQRVPISSYSVIILYGISELPNSQSLDDLTTYVNSGGGLYIIPDKETSPVRFNEFFAPMMGGFRLGALKQAERALFLDKNEANLGHSLLLPLVREEWGNPDEITCSAYFDIGNAGKASCALRTRDGYWLGAVLPIGRGRIYIQTYSCSIHDSSFPRSTVFPSMLQAILAFLANDLAEGEPDVIRAGSIHYMDLSVFKGLGGKVALTGPDRYEFPMTESGYDVRIHEIFNAGSYRAMHPNKKSDRMRWLAVNPVEGESNVVPLSPEKQEEIFGGEKVSRLPYAQLTDQFARRREIFPLMMWLVFGALAIESLTGAWQARRKAGE